MNDTASLNQRTAKGSTINPHRKIRHLILRVLGCCLLGTAFVGCGQSQESARKELAALKKDFTALDFVASAMDGDKTAVSLFLKGGMDVNTTEENGATALIAATVKKHPEIVKLLLDHGAKPDTKHNTSDQRGLTPLLMAVSGQASEIVAMLLDKKADPNLAADDGMTPLMLACGVGDVKAVNMLLKSGAKVNAADADGQTALMDAAGKEHPDVVGLLLEKGADIKVTKKDGVTALDAALGKDGIVMLGMFGTKSFEMTASKGQQDTVQVLRKAGVKPVSAFFTATLYRELGEVVTQRAFKTRSAKDTREFLFNLFDNFKAIGFDDAQMAEARSQAVGWVTKARARIGMAGMTEQSAEDKRVDQEFIELAKELMADPLVERLESSKQLLNAAAKGDLEAAKQSLSSGADPNAKNESGFTPLLYAITQRHPELVRVLIEAKADVNLGGVMGMTPLMIASALGDEGSVKLLLDKGAKPAATNEKGQTALMIAKAQKRDAVATLLEAAVSKN